MIDLGSVHLFCAGCKIFQETPSLLRWETASGSKRTAGSNPAWPPLPFRNPNRLGSIGPPQHYEIPSRLGSLGLPQPLEISSRLSGTSALQSRGAFRQLQAHSFAYPNNTEESLAQAQLGVLTQPCSDTRQGRALSWPSGPKFFPQGWDPERPLRAQDPRGTLEVLPAGVLTTGGQGRSPPQGPNQGVAPTPARASTSPRQGLLERLPEQQEGKALRGRKRKAPKELLWASTRRRRAAHRDRQLQLSNSLFWLSWQPLRSVPLGCQEEVVPTPPSPLTAPEAKASQGACSTPPRPSACAAKPSPYKSAAAPSLGVASRRGRKVRCRAAKHRVPQLEHLALQLRSKTADDPQLHAAALDYAEWVEKGQMPEESLESQLAWQVLEHCSGTPGPLDLPTLAAFADIANEAHAPGQLQPLSIAVANVTKWRPEILRWFQHTQATCLLAQETHLSLEQEAKAKATLLSEGLHSFWAGATPANHRKGGLVVATPWQAHPRLVQSLCVEGCGFLAIELPRVQWRLVIVSVYLQSSTGLQAEPNITIIAALLALLQRIPNWVVAGDWNVDMDKFAGTNIATSAGGEILGSRDAAIESGNTLDFVMASRSVAGLVRLSVDKVVPFAPHFCLMLEIDLAHGLLNLPSLKGFAGLQGSLPAPSPSPDLTHDPGPEHRPAGRPSAGNRPGPFQDKSGYPPSLRQAAPPALTIGGAKLVADPATVAFATLSGSMELSLFGKVQGRGAAVPVIFQPLLRDDRQATRWHGKPQALLQQIARGIKAHDVQQPVPWALLQLVLQFAREEKGGGSLPDWAAALGFESLQLPPQQPTITNAQREQLSGSISQELSLCRLQVSQRSREEYQQWLSNSSAGSLKPLFKSLRKYEASVERPFPSFSAASKLLLRLQQWSALWCSSGTAPAPCFEELRQRACAQARELPALGGARVARYLSKTPLKAPGPDGWTALIARALSDEQCHQLADIMRQAELSGSFPAQWAVSLVVLLPKNSEIERPIALMHLLLKAWMKLRWPLLEQWQKGFATKAWWDSCGPGFSCLDVAVRRLIEYECTHSVSEHRITLFLDLSCFYETIGHSRLVAHADTVSFPPLLLWGALCAYRGPRLLTADGLIGPPAFASKGILAGCPLAVALSKVALWPACSKVLNQKAVATADTWVDDLSVDFCGPNPQQVAAKGLRVAKALFGALAEEGLEVSFRKTTWIASSPAVEAALKQQSRGDPVQVSSVAKDLGVANAAGRARRTHFQSKRLRKGAARGVKLRALQVHRTAHRVRLSKMGCLSAAFWGHQGLGLSPKQLRAPRTHAAQAGRRQQLGSVDVVFSLGEGSCCDPLRTVVLQHWRTLHRLLFSKGVPDKYLRLWKLTWNKLKAAPKRWALVKGPIAAMIAYLQDHAVDASKPLTWQFPRGSLGGPGLWDFSGDTVSLQPSLSMASRVEEALNRLLQHAANLRIAQQDAGEGAAGGIDWTVPRRLLRTQAKRPNHLTSLRAVWQGAFFTSTKGAKRLCPLCKKVAGLRHVLLECQWWRGRGPSPPPHWAKLHAQWPAESLWVRGLPPLAYTTAPSLSPHSLTPRKTGVWYRSQTVDANNFVFGTDATGTTKDPRTRVVAVAVIACSLRDGALTEEGRITQVLPFGCNVVQGEALALALLLKHTTGVAAVTADCKPAILQAQGAFFKTAHANIWDEVWEERHRLNITWHPSHRPAPEYQDRYGDSNHWRVRLNNLADQACKEAAAGISWRQHEAQVAQLDELAEEISHFLAGRAWAILAGEEAPPLDLKPRKASRTTLPGKARAHQPKAPQPPQQQNRPGPEGGLNKKQRLEQLMASEHIHGHRFAWSHTNPTNHSIKCEVCTLFIQQTHPPEVFGRLEAQPCAHKPLPDISHFGLHPSHSFYCMGAVLLCTKCYAVHKPGQLTLTKATKEPCEGASRAHAKRRSLWAQKYLKETTAPVAIFAAGGREGQTLEARTAQSRPFGDSTASGHSESRAGCGLHTWQTAEKDGKPGASAARCKNTSARVQGVPLSAGRAPTVSAPQTTAKAPVQAPERLLNWTPVHSPVAPPLAPASNPAPAPKPKPKPKKAPATASQPKLLQFFEAQASKAAVTPSSPTSHKHPLPKLPSAQSLLPRTQTPSKQGSSSHGRASQQVGPPEGQREE